MIELQQDTIPTSASTGYDALVAPLGAMPVELHLESEPNPMYDRYLRMHKVIVGIRGAQLLEDIFYGLSEEEDPMRLKAAGWAAAEAAIIRTDKPQEHRLALLDGGLTVWQRALKEQRLRNALVEPLPDLKNNIVDFSRPHRLALDMAISPLLRALIQGDVPPEVRRSVLVDCLNIAQSNAVYLDITKKAGEARAFKEHRGFAHELNALLIFNLRCSNGWFALPSLARADSGEHHRAQTHDLTIVQQRGGRLINMTPIEIKGASTPSDRRRYKALIVRGVMHLTEGGDSNPASTLELIRAYIEGEATDSQTKAFGIISERLITMVRKYNAGEVIETIGTTRSVTTFRSVEQKDVTA